MVGYLWLFLAIFSYSGYERAPRFAVEESQRHILQCRYIIGRFSCISKLDTYPVWYFMVFLALKNTAYILASRDRNKNRP